MAAAKKENVVRSQKNVPGKPEAMKKAPAAAVKKASAKPAAAKPKK